MSALILPASAQGLTEEEQLLAQARRLVLVEFKCRLPGIPHPVTVALEQPATLELVLQSVVGAAFQILMAKQKQDEDLLANVNGVVN